MIKRIAYDTREVLTLDLLEMLLVTQPLEPRSIRMEVEQAIAFRVSEEGHLCHYWSARDAEGIDPRTTIYTIRSSAYLEEVAANYLFLTDDNPLVHVLVPGPDTCLEFIADDQTQIRLSGDIEVPE
jgi:hypothetical protein